MELAGNLGQNGFRFGVSADAATTTTRKISTTFMRRSVSWRQEEQSTAGGSHYSDGMTIVRSRRHHYRCVF
ncbi:hypothetical protein PC116_g1139 [Phytophthora cactorum]|nr:hypothetical protein PC120_g668 [Phytophthora cactorum]KAG4251154.1 hypothetical protein PC116_g1139 [Phytophthora cactorum]